MTQFLLTMSPPARFGQHPDSLRTICVRRGICFGFQPADNATSGSQEQSPWRYSIAGLTSLSANFANVGIVNTAFGDSAIDGLNPHRVDTARIIAIAVRRFIGASFRRGIWLPVGLRGRGERLLKLGLHGCNRQGDTMRLKTVRR